MALSQSRQKLKHQTYGPKDKLDALKAHIEARGRNTVQKILDSVGLKRRTVTNWLNGSVNVETAYLGGQLDQALEALTATIPLQHPDYYRYALGQMMQTVQSQDSLRDYDGKYQVVHNIPAADLKFSNLTIKYDVNSPFPLFIVVAFLKGKRRAIAQGFAFLQGDYIIMSSASEYINAFLVIRKTVNVKRDIFTGVIHILDRLNNYTYSSSMSLCHEAYQESRLEGLVGAELEARKVALDRELHRYLEQFYVRL
ncbi:hypothetical protein LJR234_005065 [Mesorhizobium amorphae]|uniref:hypothetical protein n=1 Tax=Mesorhizobium amorphae TaxID=71433 RepID=UPI003ED15EEC